MKKQDDRLLSAEQLDDKYNPDGDGEHPTYNREEWGSAAYNGKTLLGYWDWVRVQLITRGTR